jgi:SAM-dependent methyltransferase
VSIHRAAAEGFERGADAYERGRPGYPQAAITWMLDHLGVTPESMVVDLGAGTGKLTRQLVPSGPRVIAVEPVAAMRETFRRVLPTIEVLEGTAESIPLGSASADAVAAAQAFHWFATRPALAEIHRVLCPRGGLALIWNRRDLSDPLQAALEAIVRSHRGGAPAHEWDRWRDAFVGNPLFRPAGERQFRLDQAVDQEGVIDRVLSTSFIASMDDARRAEIIQRVRAATAGHDRMVLRYLTDVFLFKRQ